DISVESLGAFVAVWTLGFLCHDIGYLFEGDVPAGLTPDPLHDLHAGCALLNDFYQLHYLRYYVGSSEPRYLEELSKLGYPFFSHSSLASVANDLRRVPLAGQTLSDGVTSYVLSMDGFELFRNERCPDVEVLDEAFGEWYYRGR